MATAASAGSPPDSAASAVTPRSPDSMCALRTAAAGTAAALAIASTITPSRAPWRSSPPSTLHRSRCSSSVARPKTSTSSVRRAATTPAPDIPANSSIIRSTSPTSSTGSVAGSGRTARIVAQPTPIRPWAGAPVRNPTAGATSPGAARRSTSAISAAFSPRFEVAARRVETSASAANSTG